MTQTPGDGTKPIMPPNWVDPAPRTIDVGYPVWPEDYVRYIIQQVLNAGNGKNLPYDGCVDYGGLGYDNSLRQPWHRGDDGTAAGADDLALHLEDPTEPLELCINNTLIVDPLSNEQNIIKTRINEDPYPRAARETRDNVRLESREDPMVVSTGAPKEPKYRIIAKRATPASDLRKAGLRNPSEKNSSNK